MWRGGRGVIKAKNPDFKSLCLIDKGTLAKLKTKDDYWRVQWEKSFTSEKAEKKCDTS